MTAATSFSARLSKLSLDRICPLEFQGSKSNRRRFLEWVRSTTSGFWGIPAGLKELEVLCCTSRPCSWSSRPWFTIEFPDIAH
jgi:hypothetical protein